MKASTHQSSDYVKLLYLGSSGTGKTGSLCSLVAAGYKLRVLDMDNGLDALIAFVKRECPDKLDNINFITLRDKMKADPIRGAVVSGTPKAYTDAIKYLTKWDDDTIPSEWGADTIFVLDSLTLFGRAAFRWAQGMNPNSKDPRQWYGASQESILTVLDLLTSSEFHANVIVITHVDLQELSDGTTKGYASAIGKALGPKIPAVFNTVILAESKGTGENVRRTITTMPTATVDLKNPKSVEIPKSLPLETGMATIFKTLKA
jgi:hypothetical protein